MTVRKIYIDGYNTLRKIPRYEKLLKSDADASRRGFVEYIRRLIPQGIQIIIVFDGAGEAISGMHPVHVVFTYTRTADSWLRMAIEQEKNPRAVRVVSSDHEVVNHARVCGALTQRSEEFLATAQDSNYDVSSEKPVDRELREDEVKRWLELFSGNKD